MTVMIDTLKFARAFQQGGFDTRQSEVLAEALADAQQSGVAELVTKADLAAQGAEAGSRFDRLGARIDAVDSRIDLVEERFSKLLEQFDARAERRANRLMLAAVVLGPVIVKVLDLASKASGF